MKNKQFFFYYLTFYLNISKPQNKRTNETILCTFTTHTHHHPMTQNLFLLSYLKIFLKSIFCLFRRDSYVPYSYVQTLSNKLTFKIYKKRLGSLALSKFQWFRSLHSSLYFDLVNNRKFVPSCMNDIKDGTVFVTEDEFCRFLIGFFN